MVKLPSQFDVGFGPGTHVKPMHPADLGLQARGQAMQRLAQGIATAGDAISKAAEQREKQQNAMDLIRAETNFRTAMYDTTNSLSRNGDYNSHLPLFDQSIGQAINDSAGQIRNPLARQQFILRAQRESLSPRQHVYTNSEKLRRQDEVNDFQQKLIQGRDNYMKAPNDEERQKNLQSIDDSIAIARHSGIITPKQADDLRRQYHEGTVVDHGASSDPEGLYKYLSGGQSPGQGGQGQDNQVPRNLRPWRPGNPGPNPEEPIESPELPAQIPQGAAPSPSQAAPQAQQPSSQRVPNPFQGQSQQGPSPSAQPSVTDTMEGAASKPIPGRLVPEAPQTPQTPQAPQTLAANTAAQQSNFISRVDQENQAAAAAPAPQISASAEGGAEEGAEEGGTAGAVEAPEAQTPSPVQPASFTGLSSDNTQAETPQPQQSQTPQFPIPQGSQFQRNGNASRLGLMSVAADQLQREGVPQANLIPAAAHLVGQAEAESGFNPSLVHDGGRGYGIYGAGGDRRDAMLAWMEQNGFPKESAEGQMRYMANEAMNTPDYARTKAVLMQANPEQFGPHSYEVTSNFERPQLNNNRFPAVQNAYNAYQSAIGGQQAQSPQEQGAPQQPLQPLQIKSVDAGLPDRGQMQGVNGLVVHHTAGGGNPEGVLSTFQNRGVSAQYIMDRDGNVSRVVPEGQVANHIKTSYGDHPGFSNKNVEGIEVIARNNNDWTPAQKQAIQQFINWHQQQYGYNAQNVFGHGELNPSHREADEGMQGVTPWRQALVNGHPQQQQPQATPQRTQYAQANVGPVTATDAGQGQGTGYNPGPVTWHGQRLPPLTTGPLAGMSDTDRISLLQKLEQGFQKTNSEQSAFHTKQVQDDITRLRETGSVPMGPDGLTSIERARGIVPGRQWANLAYQWNLAKRENSVVGPLQGMSEDQALAHIQRWSPDLGPDASAESYKTAADIRDKAYNRLSAIMDMRRTDPARSVDNQYVVSKGPKGETSFERYMAPDVKAVKDAQSNPPPMTTLAGTQVPGQPLPDQQFKEKLIDARLAEQTKRGIPDYLQSPITRREAADLIGISNPAKDLQKMDPFEFQDKMKAAATRAEQLYGPKYAHDALQSAIRYMVLNKNESQDAAQILATVARGDVPRPEDVQRLSDARGIDPLASFAQAITPRSDTSLPLPAAAATMPQPAIQPNKAQVALLQANPDQWKQFDAKFGAGAAARSLMPPKGTAQAAVYAQQHREAQPQPGMLERLQSMFQGNHASPEDIAKFQSAIPMLKNLPLPRNPSAFEASQ